MPAPKPLTETPAPQLDWSRPGTPAATDFDDIYFSTDGGLEETETVFLKGCSLPERWGNRSVFTIGELGFGTGLNFLAAWRLWDSKKPRGGRLHFVSIEKYPLDQDQLGRALKSWPELRVYSDRLIQAWPGRVRGFHRLEFGDVTLTLIHEEVGPALDQLSASIDAWFLDGFSPSKNPDMWSPDIMMKIAALSAPGARLATFSVAGFVREGLAAAGFEVSKMPGFGRKRQRLEAVFPAGQTRPQQPIHPVIIGSGIGGASLVRSFIKRSINPSVIDAGDGTAASANPAAIIKPRLDLQDRPETRFFLSSYLYALAVYENAEALLQRGVRHLAKTPEESARFGRLLDQKSLPEQHLIKREGGVKFPSALVIDPVKARRQFLGETSVVKGIASAFKELENGSFAVLDDNGAELARGTHLFICVGAGIQCFQNDWELPTRYSRGQLSWGQADLKSVLTYGGYAIPMEDGVLLGATHDRLDGRDPYERRAESDQSNFDGFTAATGRAVSPIDRAGRVSIRVNMPDTLPRVFDAGNNVSIMTGLGSRGFVFAPLLAEAAVSALLGEPLPISKIMWARFQAREKPNLRARPV